MSEETQDQQFVEYIVKAIVDHPEAVKTERTIDEMGTLVSLHVSAEDMGTIIGKEGRTAKALRTLLRVLGAKNNARVNLKIIEPEGSEHVHTPREPQPSEDNTAPEQPIAAEEAPAEPAEEAPSKADEIKSKAREGLADLDVEI